MEDYSFITNSMTYSFSRINSFYSGCKREWKKHYIDCEESSNSFDGMCGGYAHKLLEKYFKNELTEWDLAGEWENNYQNEVTIPCPYPSGDSKYSSILEYFENFSFDHNKYEVLGVEKEIRFNIKDKYPIVGYIDLLLREKDTGRIILCDHKSSTIKKLKNGNISKSDEEHFLAFKRQQYLYSYVIFQEYGRVDELMWNMFKQHDTISIPWNKEEMDEVINWAYDSIEEINRETEYPANPSYFYCNSLCSVRNQYCPYKRLDMIYKVIYANCFNPKVEGYETTGALGGSMEETWVEDKHEFFRWSLNNGYDDGAILHRFDNEDNYSPSNCYWTWEDVEEEYEM